MNWLLKKCLTKGLLTVAHIWWWYNPILLMGSRGNNSMVREHMIHIFRCHYNHKRSKYMDQALILKTLSNTTHDHVRLIIRNILYSYNSIHFSRARFLWPDASLLYEPSAKTLVRARKSKL